MESWLPMMAVARNAASAIHEENPSMAKESFGGKNHRYDRSAARERRIATGMSPKLAMVRTESRRRNAVVSGRGCVLKQMRVTARSRHRPANVFLSLPRKRPLSLRIDIAVNPAAPQ